ncbi:unnamed protein product [Cladocopium goreaui]|uniref:ATPase family AAA domain-containing protein 3B n=1 Tax=Cladocopium goreaui TaxID=2562237 RepID=A0A9P1FI83_9DINO|nr:unnamed protein product [Cladocopium goreaui]
MPTDRLCVLFGSCGSAPAEGTGVRQRLQKKVAETETLLRQLHGRIEGTESSTRKVNQSVCILEREQEALEEPAIICERRILVRGQRPEEELMEDDFQVALLNERFVLEQAYKMLSAYVDAGHELQEALQELGKLMKSIDKKIGYWK